MSATTLIGSKAFAACKEAITQRTKASRLTAALTVLAWITMVALEMMSDTAGVPPASLKQPAPASGVSKDKIV